MRTPWTIQYDNGTAWWIEILINFFFVKKKNNKHKKITKTEQQKQTKHTNHTL